MTPWVPDLFLRSQSDERLVSLARAGHDRAFVAIVERYKRQLVALAWRLGAGSRAEDVVQQALLSAFAALRDGAEVEHLRGWLYQIVRNTAIRAARATAESELGEEAPAADDTAEQVERRLRAKGALAGIARLPERQRDALVLSALHGQSRSEIASSMGLSEGAVRQLLHRARASLRATVTAITPYPLASWAARGRLGGGGAPGAGERVAEFALSGGSASAAGIALKTGAIVLTTGALATGVIASHGARGPGRRHIASASASTSVRPAQSAIAPGTWEGLVRASTSRLGRGAPPHAGETGPRSTRAVAGSRPHEDRVAANAEPGPSGQQEAGRSGAAEQKTGGEPKRSEQPRAPESSGSGGDATRRSSGADRTTTERATNDTTAQVSSSTADRPSTTTTTTTTPTTTTTTATTTTATTTSTSREGG